MGSDHDEPTVVRMLVSGGGEADFWLMVEPEGMTYDVPPEQATVLLFRGSDAMDFEVCHHPDGLSIWRPGNTEVWAGPVGGPLRQIGGRRDNPFPTPDGFDPATWQPAPPA
ncbi:hypothetical protein ABZS66_40490 [Dactylosporangium sp. NPDC005572]|uniref:hypothetical protein n=1 Tax=Dactylosporangium sp. NPDC005572 TaxID=3156889 RepID=UPI0033B7C6DD